MKILVVDDIEINRKLLRATLEAEDFLVFEAADGKQALDLLRVQQIDVVITDVLMPNMDGYQLCRAIRADSEFNKIGIVIYTSTHFDIHQQKLAFECGANSFLEKPTPVSGMVEAIIRAAEEGGDSSRFEATSIPGELDVLKQYSETLVTKVTEKNQELARSERKYRQIVANIPDIIWSADSQGRLNFISPNVERILGFPAADFSAEHSGRWIEKIHPEDRDSVKAAYSAMFTDLTDYDMEYRIRRPNGRWNWVQDRATASGEGRSDVIADGILSDISMRKRAELGSQLQLQVTEILAGSSDTKDACRKVMRAITESQGWAAAVRWRRSGNSKIHFQDSWSPPDAALDTYIEAIHSHTFETGEGLPGLIWNSREPLCIPEMAHDRRFLRRELATSLGLSGVFGFPIFYHGEVSGVFEFISREPIFLDEAEMRVFAAIGGQIGQFVEKRKAEDLFRQSQKLETVGQLAGGIAHDFNNLLTVISCHTSFAIKGVTQHSPIRPDLEQIEKAVSMAAALTRQLLSFSRRQLVEPRVLDLAATVSGIESMLKRLIGSTIELTTINSADTARIKIDPSQLEQILVNLVVNSRDAMPEGGKIVIESSAIELTSPQIGEKHELPRGRYVVLSISDTGCGMTDAVKERIFEPFFTTKEVGRGTGLGLATCFGIVKQARGHISVYSEFNRGTTFKIYLPNVEEAPVTAALPAPAAMGRGNETILLVEDEPALRSVIGRLLAEFGYQVIEAKNGNEAIEILSRRSDKEIGLVLTDMVMPGIGGKGLSNWINVHRPKMRLLFTSGYTADSIAQREIVPGSINFIQKPFTVDSLTAKIREVLDQTDLPR